MLFDTASSVYLYTFECDALLVMDMVCTSDVGGHHCRFHTMMLHLVSALHRFGCLDVLGRAVM